MKNYVLLFSLLLFQSDVCAKSVFFNKIGSTINSMFAKTSENIIQKEFKKTKKIELLNNVGDIIITGWQQENVAVEIIEKASEEHLKNIKFETKQVDDILQIQTVVEDDSIKSEVVYNILAPENIELKLFTTSGTVIIKNVAGKIDVYTEHGSIKIINCKSDVKAITENGNISIRSQSLTPDSHIDLTSEKGSIKLYLTQAINSSIKAFTPNGKVTSELLILLERKQIKLNPMTWKEFKQEAVGTIGSPESSIQATAHNGSIIILPYKNKP